MKNQYLNGYWKTNLALISILLLVWAAVSCFGGILFIEPLNEFTIGKLPLGFWIANQGSMLVFVALILIYAVVMDFVDRRYLSQSSTGDRSLDD